MRFQFSFLCDFPVLNPCWYLTKVSRLDLYVSGDRLPHLTPLSCLSFWEWGGAFSDKGGWEKVAESCSDCMVIHLCPSLFSSLSEGWGGWGRDCSTLACPNSYLNWSLPVHQAPNHPAHIHQTVTQNENLVLHQHPHFCKAQHMHLHFWNLSFCIHIQIRDLRIRRCLILIFTYLQKLKMPPAVMKNPKQQYQPFHWIWLRSITRKKRLVVDGDPVKW